ncbi:MAG: type IV toxin-antitoxin system AbiEi family antitoxin domain-containing protein [Clostridia bacterium]|nr:type IV toxin-antitoxin system AbiEi family antitoxin domain-containing protein [Clostridia bacterium]
MRDIAQIRDVFSRYGDLMKTSELFNERLYYQNLQRLEEDGYIEKVRYGYYRWAQDEEPNEADIVSRLFPDGILCMETAMSYYGYTEALPERWHIAVSKDSTKSRFNIDYPFVKPYYVEQELLTLGECEGEIDGARVRLYDRERLLCDCLRYRNRIDKDLFNSVVRAYIDDPMRNISHLNEYASTLRVSQKARDLLAIWL